MEPVELTDEHLEALNRRRSTIVNWDTGAIFAPYTTEGAEPEQIIDYAFSFYRGGDHHIDSIWFCFGEGDSAVYPSEALPTIDLPNYATWIAEGVDLVRMYGEEIRKLGIECFYSLRMNGADPGENFLPTSGKYETDKYKFLPQKRAHMDWLTRVWTVDPEQANKEDPEDCVYLWNYALPEVREYKLSIVRELAEIYDFDGIELDFARLAPHLPMGHQWEQRQALTDFVASVRQVFLDVERRRGRPLLLAVRVPESVEGARMDGLDLEAWARNQLVDIFVPGPRAIQVDIPEFRRITQGTSIKICPCLDGFHSSDGYGCPPMEVLRGTLTNWWSQGADGIEFFNCFGLTHEAFDRMGPSVLEAWRHAVGDRHHELYAEHSGPSSTRGKDKTFVIDRRGGGFNEPWRFPLTDEWHTPKYSYFNTNMLGQLPAPISNQGDLDTLLTLDVGDDVNEDVSRVDRITLRVLLSDPDAEGLPDQDRLEEALVRAPGTKHGPSANKPPRRGIGEQVEARINGVRLGQASVTGGWLAFDVQPVQLAFGKNLIGLRVDGRDGTQAEMQIEKVELDIVYQ